MGRKKKSRAIPIPKEDPQIDLTLYHLSRHNLDGQLVYPSIPSNYLVRAGFEDDKTRRICCAHSIDSCLMALGENLTGEVFYVHVPLKPFMSMYPTTDKVPDADITGECWVLDPVRMSLIGMIKIDSMNAQDYTYYYGSDNLAKLYGTDWHWVEA